MKYKMRVNISHDGQDFKAGDSCPEKFVKPLLEQGHLVPDMSVAAPAGEVDSDPVGDAEDEESEGQGEDEEASETESEDEAPKARRASKKRAG